MLGSHQYLQQQIGEHIQPRFSGAAAGCLGVQCNVSALPCSAAQQLCKHVERESNLWQSWISAAPNIRQVQSTQSSAACTYDKTWLALMIPAMHAAQHVHHPRTWQWIYLHECCARPRLQCRYGGEGILYVPRVHARDVQSAFGACGAHSSALLTGSFCSGRRPCRLPHRA